MCNGCKLNMWRQPNWWTYRNNQQCCSFLGTEPKDRANASGAPQTQRKHVTKPQVKSAPTADFRVPIPKYQGGERLSSASPSVSASSGARFSDAEALAAVAAWSEGGTPAVLQDSKGSITGKLCNKGPRRKRDVGTVLGAVALGAAALIAPEDPMGAAREMHARLGAVLAVPLRARVKAAEAAVAAAALGAAEGLGVRRATHAAAAAAAAGAELADAREQLQACIKGGKESLALQALFQGMKEQSPVQRRPQMAAVCQKSCKLTRDDVSAMLGSKVSKPEYAAARQHARCPGVGEPVQKVQQFRLKVSSKWLQHLLAFLSEPDMLAQHAFGLKLIELETQSVLVPAVELRKQLETITYDYIMELDKQLAKDGPPGVPLSRRCTADDKHCGGARRCLKANLHGGQHKFTPTGSMCANTIKDLVKTLTHGEIRSLGGLDDCCVTAGHNNYAEMRRIAAELGTACSASETELVGVVAAIDQSDTFHKCSFTRHIARNADCACACADCGYHTTDEPLPCPKRNGSHSHSHACCGCADSYAVFDQLRALHARALVAVGSGANSAIARDELGRTGARIEHCESQFKTYRAHLVAKKTEADADGAEVAALEDDQAIVVSDWKMKLLSAFHRENMKLFYGKRGTSVMGFMVITNSQDASDGKDVCFFILLTDDSKQDETNVAAAKMALYKELLPKAVPHVTQVLFRSDGAGCFRSSFLHAIMPMWKEWTGIDEVSYRVSAPGGGKSDLDGHFAHFGGLLARGVAAGGDHTDAVSAAALANDGAGLKATTVAVYTAVRPGTPPKVTNKGLDLYHHVRTEGSGTQRALRCFSHTGFGSGIRVLVSQLSWAGGVAPEAPGYALDIGGQSERARIKSEARSKHCAGRAAKRQRVSKTARVEKKNSEVVAAAIARATWREECGLHPCRAIDSHNRMCRKIYSTEINLDKHTDATGRAKSSHSFGSLNARQAIVKLSQQHSGMLTAAARPDRDQTAAAAAVMPSATACPSAEAVGQYKKPPRAESHYMTHQQLDYLEGIFDEGEANKTNRVSPTAANESMRLARRPGDGLLQYGEGKADGALPGAERIKSWFSQEAQRKGSLKGRFKPGSKRRRVKGCSCAFCIAPPAGGGGGGTRGQRKCGKCRETGHDVRKCPLADGNDKPAWASWTDGWNDECEVCSDGEDEEDDDGTHWCCRCCNIVVCKEGSCVAELDAAHPATSGHRFLVPPGEAEEQYVCPMCFEEYGGELEPDSDDE
jgi:hypothetical protein